MYIDLDSLTPDRVYSRMTQTLTPRPSPGSFRRTRTYESRANPRSASPLALWERDGVRGTVMAPATYIFWGGAGTMTASTLELL
jgi:hypothetical protein